MRVSPQDRTVAYASFDGPVKMRYTGFESVLGIVALWL